MVNNYSPPSQKERDRARDALERLRLKQNGDEPLRHFITDSEREEPIELPAAAVAVLSDVLKFMSLGHGLTLFPRPAEVTTMEAADILNVSRPYVIKLLEEGKMPYRKVGKRRRIRLEDVLDYDAKSKARSRAAMDEIVALSQEMGLYD